MNIEEIKYKRNVINQVIARVDFFQPYDNDTIFSDIITNNIKLHFPLGEMVQILRYGEINIPISTNQFQPPVQNTMHEGQLRQFFTSTKKSGLILSNTHIVFHTQDYNTFEEFKATIVPIITLINPIKAVRIGIRYVNLFNSNTIRPLKSYFTQPYSSYLSKSYINQTSYPMIRSMNLAEYQINDMKLSFRSGLYNSKYPNKINDMEFTLDFDCYTQETINGPDLIVRYIDEGHKAIQSLFESSITDTLRKVLNNAK